MRAYLLIGLVLFASPALAGSSMKVDPGKWELTRTGSFLGTGEDVSTNTECVREDSMTPEQFTSEMEGCKLSDVKTDARAMSWKMTCASPMGEMKGKGDFRSTGSTISGTLELTMKVGDEPAEMKNTWSGRRVGECK